jgi:hypothetical protein
MQAVFEHAVLGPEQTPPHLMPWWPRPGDGHDITTAVTRLIDGTVELLTRAAPLVWSVVGDEGARARYDHNEQLRRYGYADRTSLTMGRIRLILLCAVVGVARAASLRGFMTQLADPMGHDSQSIQMTRFR